MMGATIDLVGIGEVDDATLSRLAGFGGGRFQHVADPEALRTTLVEVATSE